jgi:predicted metal-dependent phosphoesterase TrpH
MDHRRRGMAVIAHPARYKFTANEEYALFTEFKAHGGRRWRW